MIGGHWIHVLGEATFEYLHHSHCDAKDKNGVLQPNLGDKELMEDMEDRPEEYEGKHYVALIPEVLNEDGLYDLSYSAEFIRNGGEWFCKR